LYLVITTVNKEVVRDWRIPRIDMQNSITERCTYLPVIDAHSLPKLAHSFLLLTLGSHPVFFPSISTNLDWFGDSNCNIPTPQLLFSSLSDLALLQPAAPSTEPITPVSPIEFRLRTLLVVPGMVLTDDEIADMSLYSPPFSDTPRNTHRVSEVLKRETAHNFGDDTDTNRIIEYEYDMMMYNMSEKAIKGT